MHLPILKGVIDLRIMDELDEFEGFEGIDSNLQWESL